MQHVDEGRLHAWLDGELPDDERWVERHLEDCEACRARAAEERRIRDAASAILGRADPGEVAPRRIVPLPAARRRRPWVTVGWAASVLLALGIGWMARPAERQVAIAPATAPARAPESTDAAPVSIGAAPVSTDAAPAPAEPLAQNAPASGGRVAQASRPTAGTRPSSEEARASAPVASVAVAIPAPELAAPLPPPPPPSAPPPPPAEVMPPEAAGSRTYALEAPAARERTGDTLTVRGRVTDAQGQALPGVVIAVPALSLRTVTKADGSYALAVPAERVEETNGVQVHASRIGLAAQTRSFAADVETIDFKLTPDVLALEGLVVDATKRSARVGSDGGWRTSAQAEAERHLRHPLTIVPGLPVVGIEVGRVDGRAAARVRQRLPGGEILSLTQRRAASPADTASPPPSVTVLRGRLRVDASAPVPMDSIRALLF